MDESWMTEELIQNTFLYCMKRLHDTVEAEDLAQEILTEALVSYRRRREQITAVYAWFWKLAHHRYCLYLRKKQYGAVSLEEVGGILPADVPDPAEGIIAEEELSALNLALSRLSAIHRETIIRYYLQNQTTREIAEDLGVPEGTIKRRLFDAKEQIREDFTMTNTGRSAYAPAELYMNGGYNIPKHWEKLQDLMTKQILITCRKEACTIREISDEIGVAPVYFEEKLNYLLEHKFLKETAKGKYLTDFVILPEEAYRDYYLEKAKVFQNVGAELTELLTELEPDIRSIGFYGNHFAYNYLMWILYVIASDMLGQKMRELYERTLDPSVPANNGKEYRIMGRVKFPDEIISYRDLHAVSWSNLWQQFTTSGYRRVSYVNYFQAEPFGDRDRILNNSNADLFLRIYEDPDCILTETEKEKAAFLVEKGYLQKTDTGYLLTMPVFPLDSWKKVEKVILQKLDILAEKYMNTMRCLADRLLLPHIRKDMMEEYVHFIMESAFYAVDFVFTYAIDNQSLAIPAEYMSSAAGICLIVQK
ncbi:MAG: RNA polymerase sigma factor [Anaerotignum sp.]|nr:RNA polymerase sigma factor [Anaerotignum sp.]